MVEGHISWDRESRQYPHCVPSGEADDTYKLCKIGWHMPTHVSPSYVRGVPQGVHIDSHGAGLVCHRERERARARERERGSAIVLTERVIYPAESMPPPCVCVCVCVCVYK
jgi:hypothetical protein